MGLIERRLRDVNLNIFAGILEERSGVRGLPISGHLEGGVELDGIPVWGE